MIPEFNERGVLPSMMPEHGEQKARRAPYASDMLTICKRFGYTSQRRKILCGLLNLRQKLRELGVSSGFQWLDGSFVEDVEALRGRPPADIDVVTFCAFNEHDQNELIRRAPQLFVPPLPKEKYHVDHFIVQTDAGTASANAGKILVEYAAYWYSMWAHQRVTLRLKGFVSVPLDSNDSAARGWLQEYGDSVGDTP